MHPRELFNQAAIAEVQRQVEHLRHDLTYEGAKALPEAAANDVVIEGREVTLTIFRQAGLSMLGDGVLITVQIARHGLGGMVSYHTERGLVFEPQGAPRDATEQELQDSGG
jgi:hypothetical protein